MNNAKSSFETQTLPADAHGIAEAARLIVSGEVVAIPTETVYGLAADASNSKAVARIYAAKGRPSFNPLIVHVSHQAMAETLVDVSTEAARLMQEFWPGPLTLVLPLKVGAPVSSLVTAGLNTLAVRCPAHEAARQLIKQSGKTLAAPSANASGRISPTRASHVMHTLAGRIPLILDGGACSAGVESTIVALIEGKAYLLREGAIAAERLNLQFEPPSTLIDTARPSPNNAKVKDQPLVTPTADNKLSETPAFENSSAANADKAHAATDHATNDKVAPTASSYPKATVNTPLIHAEKKAAAAASVPVSAPAPALLLAPGMMESHYAPVQPVRLDAIHAEKGEFHIGFGAVAGDLNLSPSGSLLEAAAMLFDALHQAEASSANAIAIAPIPHQGLGRAINDRLRRAAAPRP